MVIYLKRYHWYVSKSNSSDSKYVFSIVTFFLLTSLADRIISKRGRKFLVREKEKKKETLQRTKHEIVSIHVQRYSA